VPKAYWIVTYREIRDFDALAAYAKLAGPAVIAAGGRFLARGMPHTVKEEGLQQRVVLVEFDDIAAATRLYESPSYQRALAELKGDAVVRDVRFVEGV
jgi:uncharacterized protein (DUF1330 family)